MEATKKHITELHEENKKWLSELQFSEDELNVFKKRISEIALKYTDKHVLASVDHFENQFKIQQNIIDELMHVINQKEQTMEQVLMENPVAAQHKLVEDHAETRGKMLMFSKLFKELKQELNSFLSKTM